MIGYTKLITAVNFKGDRDEKSHLFKYFQTNEPPRSRAARYQKEFSFNPDAEHRGILLIKNKRA